MLFKSVNTVMIDDFEQYRASVGEPVSLGRLLEWTRGRFLGPTSLLEEPVRGLAIDSRALADGDLFAALPGEHVDGHDFLAEVASTAQAALVSRPDPNPALAQIVVEDVPRALLRIAKKIRRRFPALTVIGITGSVGKTTTKDYLGAILTRFAPTVVSPGNMNTVYGVPLTLARLRRSDRLAVVEMGMQWAGEIASLVEAARPRMGIVTAVGPAHLEFFSSVEEIARAKAELLEGLPTDGTALLPLESDYYGFLAAHAPCPVVTFGLNEGDCRAEGVVHGREGSRFELVWTPPGGTASEAARFEIGLRIPGNHHVLSALRAAAAGLILGVKPEMIVNALADAQTTPLRGEVCRRGDVTVLDDSYNANPLSMSAALETLVELPGRPVAVLGDMLDLGPTAPQLHYDLGKEAAERGIALLIAVGEYAGEIVRGARDHGLTSIYEAADRHGALEILHGVLQPDDVLLVKASRALRLDLLIEGITKP